jgi:GntR family transcriptional regulator, transcriptional repressor for pyruvate dehydrogenase complex
MKTLNRPKLSDMVCESLIQYVLDESLKPGDKLPSENELTQRLGIGRTSVREGIKQLEASGLLTGRQGFGITINEIGIEDILDINKKFSMAKFLVLTKREILDLMSFRILLEVEACTLAAQRITSEDLRILNKLLKKMNESEMEPYSFIDYDMQFHKQIVLASGNTIYPKIFNIIDDLFWKQQTITSTLPGAKHKAIEYHRNIYAALEINDSDHAANLMRTHLEITRTVLSNNL